MHVAYVLILQDFVDYRAAGMVVEHNEEPEEHRHSRRHHRRRLGYAVLVGTALFFERFFFVFHLGVMPRVRSMLLFAIILIMYLVNKNIC